MARLNYAAWRPRSRARITCWACRRTVVLPTAVPVQLLYLGDTGTIFDLSTLACVHSCRTYFHWWCDHCRQVPEWPLKPWSRRQRAYRRPRCPACRRDLRQVVLSFG